jgi:hypothetical protein
MFAALALWLRRLWRTHVVCPDPYEQLPETLGRFTSKLSFETRIVECMVVVGEGWEAVVSPEHRHQKVLVWHNGQREEFYDLSPRSGKFETPYCPN